MTPPETKRVWVPLMQMARLIGISRTHFNQSVRPLLVDHAWKREKGKLYFDSPMVIEAWVCHKTPRPPPVRPIGRDLDRDMEMNFDAADSPALEKYRHFKAKMAEIEYEQKAGLVLNREVLLEDSRHVASMLRRTGELVGKKFGPEAAKLVSEGFAEAERAMEEALAGEAGTEHS